MTIPSPSPLDDVGFCFLCDQFYFQKCPALSEKAVGYLPACGECFKFLTGSQEFLDDFFGSEDPVLRDLDAAKVSLWELMVNSQGSKEVQS